MIYPNHILDGIPGCDVTAMLDGKFRHELTQALCELLPATETEFMALDLDTLSGIPAEQIDALKGVQCKLIRQKRSELYAFECDGLYMGAVGDGDALDDWRSKRAEIKARYPWPGDYR